MIEYTFYQDSDEYNVYVSEVLDQLHDRDFESDYLETILQEEWEDFNRLY